MLALLMVSFVFVPFHSEAKKTKKLAYKKWTKREYKKLNLDKKFLLADYVLSLEQVQKLSAKDVAIYYSFLNQLVTLVELSENKNFYFPKKPIKKSKRKTSWSDTNLLQKTYSLIFPQAEAICGTGACVGTGIAALWTARALYGGVSALVRISPRLASGAARIATKGVEKLQASRFGSISRFGNRVADGIKARGAASGAGTVARTAAAGGAGGGAGGTLALTAQAGGGALVPAMTRTVSTAMRSFTASTRAGRNSWAQAASFLKRHGGTAVTALSWGSIGYALRPYIEGLGADQSLSEQEVADQKKQALAIQAMIDAVSKGEADPSDLPGLNKDLYTAHKKPGNSCMFAGHISEYIQKPNGVYCKAVGVNHKSCKEKPPEGGPTVACNDFGLIDTGVCVAMYAKPNGINDLTVRCSLAVQEVVVPNLVANLVANKQKVDAEGYSQYAQALKAKLVEWELDRPSGKDKKPLVEYCADHNKVNGHRQARECRAMLGLLSNLRNATGIEDVLVQAEIAPAGPSEAPAAADSESAS